MDKTLKVAPQVIRGFEASLADASLYQAVAKGSANKFGEDSKAYATVMNGINTNEGKGSQFFFNNEAGLYLPKNQRVATLADIGKISDADTGSVNERFFDGSFYTDTPELVLRTATPSWKNNTKVLEHLVKQAKHRGLEFSPEKPLLLTNLELARDEDKDNPYGVLVNITDATTARNDLRFAYGTNTIKTGSKERKLWTKEQGLSRVCLNWNGIDSNDGNLAYSNDNGRVVVMDAEDVAPNNYTAGDVAKALHDLNLAGLEPILRKKLKERNHFNF